MVGVVSSRMRKKGGGGSAERAEREDVIQHFRDVILPRELREQVGRRWWWW